MEASVHTHTAHGRTAYRSAQFAPVVLGRNGDGDTATNENDGDMKAKNILALTAKANRSILLLRSAFNGKWEMFWLAHIHTQFHGYDWGSVSIMCTQHSSNAMWMCWLLSICGWWSTPSQSAYPTYTNTQRHTYGELSHIPHNEHTMPN